MGSRPSSPLSAPKARFAVGQHGVRLEMPPALAGAAAGAIGVLIAWSAFTAGAALLGDNSLAISQSDQIASARAYRAENLTLRQELERLAVKRSVERAAVGEQLDELTRRQAAIEQRQGTIGALARGEAEPFPMARPMMPPPATDKGEPATRPVRESRATHPMPDLSGDSTASHADRFAALAQTYDNLEAHQIATLARLEERTERYRAHLGAVYATAGIKPPGKAVREDAVGGPYIPLSFSPAGNSFQQSLTRVAEAAAEARRLAGGLSRLPVRAPIANAEETSSFGSRKDPFLNAYGFHAGIDFRAEQGSAVHVTANGKVTEAGWATGYGNMIEVDHGNGLRTRYGHLSAIRVANGQQVTAGDVIGLVGSTGRSTGPHLHYETRIDDTPVNPERFLAAGQKLQQAAALAPSPPLDLRR